MLVLYSLVPFQGFQLAYQEQIFLKYLVFLVAFFYLFVSIDAKEKPSLLDILKKRLAKGEITQEQFESIKATLKLKEEI